MPKRERGTTVFSNTPGGEPDPLTKEPVVGGQSADSTENNASEATENQPASEEVLSELFDYRADVSPTARAQYLRKLWKMMGLKGQFRESVLKQTAEERIRSGQLPVGVIERPPKRDNSQDAFKRLEQEVEAIESAAPPDPEVVVESSDKAPQTPKDVKRVLRAPMQEQEETLPDGSRIVKRPLEPRVSEILEELRAETSIAKEAIDVTETKDTGNAKNRAKYGKQITDLHNILRGTRSSLDEKIRAAYVLEDEYWQRLQTAGSGNRRREYEDKLAQVRLLRQGFVKEHQRASLTAQAGAEKDVQLTRDAAQVTLARVPEFKTLHAETEAEGMEKFKEMTRQTWAKDFVVHGIMEFDAKTGKVTIKNKTDLDGKAVLGLLKLAGFEFDPKVDVQYVAAGKPLEGKINWDTSNRKGFEIEQDGQTAHGDHHTQDSGQELSASKIAYEVLTKLELLKESPELNQLVDFITKCDNMAYPAMEYGKKSYNTMIGLRRHLSFNQLHNFIVRDHQDPTAAIPEERLKRIIVAPERLDKKTGEVKRVAPTLFDRSEQRRLQLDQDEARLYKMVEEGLIVDSPDYGNIVVDINGTVKTGADMAKAFGAGAFIKWMPKTRSFFVTSFGAPLKGKFAQGIPVRDTMWIKPMNDETPLTTKLEDVLMQMTNGALKPMGKLKEYLEAPAKKKDKKSKEAKEPKATPETGEELKLRQLAEQILDRKYEEQMTKVGMTDEEKATARSRPYITGQREISIKKLIAQFKSQS